MPKQILIVDDSKTIRLQIAAPIKEAGYDIVEAGDGREALAQLTCSPNVVMVIADVNMPIMNGLEMVEALRARPRDAKLPVVMLTTEGQSELLERAKKAGVKGWLVKPFKPEQLVATVRKLAGTP